MWHYGAVANMTIDSWDGTNIVISRLDPPGTYSSQWAMPDGYFRAKYTGAVVDGNRIEGDVVWDENPKNAGKWHATIQTELCDATQKCPLEMAQILSLGLLAYGNKVYGAAFDTFLYAAKEGSPHGKGLLANMLYEEKGNGPRQVRGFELAQDSATTGSAFGMEALGKMYRDGIGTQRNAKMAKYWFEKAAQVKPQQMAELDARTQSVNKATTQSGAGLYGALLGFLLIASFGSIDDSSSPRSGPSEHDIYMQNQAQWRANQQRDAQYKAGNH